MSDIIKTVQCFIEEKAKEQKYFEDQEQQKILQNEAEFNEIFDRSE